MSNRQQPSHFNGLSPGQEAFVAGIRFPGDPPPAPPQTPLDQVHASLAKITEAADQRAKAEALTRRGLSPGAAAFAAGIKFPQG